MGERVLITGGAGFIGSHVAEELLAAGYSVRVLDCLHPQVHENGRPDYLSHDVELVLGDVRDAETVERALARIDSVIHLAARVGVGQSMYELGGYAATNTFGTAVLLEALAAHRPRRLLVASSMSIYGEGLYRTSTGEPVEDAERTRAQLEAGDWDPAGARGQPLVPVRTPEWKRPCLSSVYALTKYDQERLCLLYGAAYDLPTTALRFFNVYGRYQALSNPYTGVLAIFASRLLNGRPPLVFEDGQQRRDFVSVRDVARACRLALERDEAAGRAINVGSGRSVTVLDIASKLGDVLDVRIEPELTGTSRAGDIRHCFADMRLATELLGFAPQVDLEDGIAELAEWLERAEAVDRVDHAARELAARGLTV